MTNPKEAYASIVEITGGDCFGREGLSDPVPTIGLDGRFTSAQLDEVVRIMVEIKCK